MEFFNKAKEVRLRSHHGKYLLADEDEETVRQSRNGASPGTRWTVEFAPGSNHHIRLKSCYGKYLTASDQQFLVGLPGKKIVQDMPTSRQDNRIVWEPRTEGLHVKLRTKGGKFLRANGGMPPRRNSITHDVPHRAVTQDWVLWEVDVVDILVVDSLPPDYISPVSSFSTVTSSDFVVSECSDTSYRSAYSTTSSNKRVYAGEVAREIEARKSSGTAEQSEETIYGWQSPEEAWIKVNTDSIVTKSAAIAAAGGVVRDSNGQWLRGFMHRLPPCYSAAMAQIWGVYSGLSVAWELKVSKVVVEIDNSEVLEVLLRQVYSRPEEIPLLECVWDLVGREWTVHFVHTYKECNLVAKWLAKQALKQDDGLMILHSPPDECLSFLLEDAIDALL